jgi:hypothetical protein
VNNFFFVHSLIATVFLHFYDYHASSQAKGDDSDEYRETLFIVTLGLRIFFFYKDLAPFLNKLEFSSPKDDLYQV